MPKSSKKNNTNLPNSDEVSNEISSEVSYKDSTSTEILDASKKPKPKTKTKIKSEPKLSSASKSKISNDKNLKEDVKNSPSKKIKNSNDSKASENSETSKNVTGLIESDLNGCILIAMPDLENSIFSQSVVFICDHAEHGSLGVVLNKPINLSLADLFDKLELPYKKKAKYLQQPILLGGPVESDKGFVIHPNQKTKFLSNIERDLTMTTSMDILEHLAQKTGPEKFIIALGCAMWEAGQLLDEIRENRWLVWHLGGNQKEKIDQLEEFVFNTEVSKKYTVALKHLGLELWQLTMFGGNA